MLKKEKTIKIKKIFKEIIIYYDEGKY